MCRSAADMTKRTQKWIKSGKRPRTDECGGVFLAKQCEICYTAVKALSIDGRRSATPLRRVRLMGMKPVRFIVCTAILLYILTIYAK